MKFSKTEAFLILKAGRDPNGIIHIRCGEQSTRLGKRFGNRRMMAGIALRNQGIFKVVELTSEQVGRHHFNTTVYRLQKKVI